MSHKTSFLLFLISLSLTSVVVFGYHINHNHATEWNHTTPGGGNINMTWSLNGQYIYVNETATTPGFSLDFNVTLEKSGTLPQYLTMFQRYIGNPAHVVNLYILNSSNDWVLLGDIPNTASMEFYNYSLVTLIHEGIVDSDLKLQFRILHVSPGTPGHSLRIDYISVETIDNDESTLTAWDINWLTALVWICLLGLSYFRNLGPLKAFSGVIGLVLGLYLLDSSQIIGLLLICLNLYLIYEGTEDQ